MTGEIVLAFSPSRFMKDWGLRFDETGTFYEPYTRFYDTGCEKLSSGFCDIHRRAVGREPYYDMVAKAVVAPPRVYITHHPQKGEWEKHKTIDDVIASPLFKEKI